MKYSEFRRLVKDMNYNLEETEEVICVRKKVLDRPIARVGKDKRFIFSFYTAFEELKEAEQEDLFELLYRLAKTPLEEREEEKRYRLRFIGEVDDGCCYLNISRNGTKTFNTKSDDEWFKTIFTESELKHIDEAGFIREEVTG
jgi:hypothetical protein